MIDQYMYELMFECSRYRNINSIVIDKELLLNPEQVKKFREMKPRAVAVKKAA
jgi:hypothetical protein